MPAFGANNPVKITVSGAGSLTGIPRGAEITVRIKSGEDIRLNANGTSLTDSPEYEAGEIVLLKIHNRKLNYDGAGQIAVEI